MWTSICIIKRRATQDIMLGSRYLSLESNQNAFENISLLSRVRSTVDGHFIGVGKIQIDTGGKMYSMIHALAAMTALE